MMQKVCPTSNLEIRRGYATGLRGRGDRSSHWNDLRLGERRVSMREMVMSQQPVSESVLTNNYRCATLAHVSRPFLGRLRSCRAPEARPPDPGWQCRHPVARCCWSPAPHGTHSGVDAGRVQESLQLPRSTACP